MLVMKQMNPKQNDRKTEIILLSRQRCVDLSEGKAAIYARYHVLIQFQIILVMVFIVDLYVYFSNFYLL